MATDIEVGQNRAGLQSIKDTHNTAVEATVKNRRRSGFRRDLFTANGDGSTTVFNIPHGLTDLYGNGVAPKSYNVDGQNTVSKAAFQTSKGVTNIIVTYAAAPASGTGNVQLNWQAWV